MIDAVISGVLLGMALMLSLGPAIFTIIKLRINYGKSSAYFFASGIWLSDLIWIVTANLFGGLFENVIKHRIIIGFSGGLFLIGLGLFYLFFKKYHTQEEMERGIKIGAATHARLFLTGFFMNMLNPGVIALWLAAVTKMVANQFTLQERAVTFTICIAISLLADVMKINLAGRLRKKLTYKNIKIINKVSGSIFILFGIALIVGVVKLLGK